MAQDSTTVGEWHLLAFSGLRLSEAAVLHSHEAESALRALSLHGASADVPLARRASLDACLHIEAFASAKLNGRQPSIADTLRARAATGSKKDVSAAYAADATLAAGGGVSLLKVASALNAALKEGAGARNGLSSQTFARIHNCLLDGTNRQMSKARIRTSERQIGGNRYRSASDATALPAAASVPALLRELARFCSETAMPAVAQAAIAHLLFLAIHPYERANGKTAGALIPLVLAHRGIAVDALPPISLALALASHDYHSLTTAALNVLPELALLPSAAAKKSASPTSALAAINDYVVFFAASCKQASEDALAFLTLCAAHQRKWLGRLSQRSDSAATQLVWALPALPVFTVAQAAEYTGRSFKRVCVAVEELQKLDAVAQANKGKRNRVFECPAIVECYAALPGFQ